ncbi:ankyrin repeat-containing protein ITN1-like [Chenopodium quinoa]|uniref:ankyrin repeat-containing protein ITN1-like n=1 Tax=Chenopodium quinoa TaxID=63459 RepID=UPI000B783D68|nr:ankyrin repeat-containing protein ITN1-like [Chenopodium quinoa]
MSSTLGMGMEEREGSCGQDESRHNFLKYGVPLYQAAMEGDWEAADMIFKEDPRWITAPITKRNDTTLLIAAAAKHLEFVTKLVDLMIKGGDLLESRNTLGNTAFCIAASSGNVEIAKVMVRKNQQLPDIKGSKNLTPLHMAILLGHKEMVKYLIEVTDDSLLKDEDRIELLTSAIEAHLYDVALGFINKHPHLAVHRNRKDETVLHTLAARHLQSHTPKQSLWEKLLSQCTKMLGKDEKEQQLGFALKVTQRAWNEVIKEDENGISQLIGLPWRLLFVAAEMGNVDFLTTLILSYPDVIWKIDDKNSSIFHVAVVCRHEEISKLIHEIGAIKDLIASYTDYEHNNMLHLAAKIAPPDRLNCVSGAALQMQRELLWFEAVQDDVQPHYAVAKNISRKTPQTLFTEEHNELRLQGEQWMKKTAESCTLIATVIATVIFTAAFTLPGGNNDKDGSPIPLNKASFKVFVISNAVSLFASSTSILMFLSILTSRYAEKDFLKVLPFKLVVGLTSLIVSIAAMMIAFTATFFITFQKGSIWIPAPIALLAAIPVMLFGFQQYPLLWDIYSSTYPSWTFFQPSKKRKLLWKSKSPKTKLS